MTIGLATPETAPAPAPPPNRTQQVAILVFDGVEALDLAGPFEVFTTASRMQQRAEPDAPPAFEVSCVARTRQPICARAGMVVVPSHSFETSPPVSVLIVPGGVVDQAMLCPETQAWIASLHPGTHITASVCTGAFLLAASGVLQSGPVTTHWEDQADLARQFPALDVQSNVRWVDQGRIVTSGGISAGIDMSLHLVARLTTEALALRTARQMEFEWTREA